MTETRERLLDAIGAAVQDYDEAVEEERATAKQYSTALEVIAEAGGKARRLANQKRHGAYEAYLLARSNYTASMPPARKET